MSVFDFGMKCAPKCSLRAPFSKQNLLGRSCTVVSIELVSDELHHASFARTAVRTVSGLRDTSNDMNPSNSFTNVRGRARKRLELARKWRIPVNSEICNDNGSNLSAGAWLCLLVRAHVCQTHTYLMWEIVQLVAADVKRSQMGHVTQILGVLREEVVAGMESM